MAEIDVLLSASLKRSAQPGDAAGVADAIRARVAAGDTGTPATESGFGGGGPSSWLPWVGLLVVAGLVGGSVGATGVFGREIDEVTVPSSTAILSESATAYACPGGPVVGSVAAGARVLAIKRSETSDYLAVRDPHDLRSTVWLARTLVVVDAGLDVATLPIGACPVVTIPKPVVVAPVPPVEGPSDSIAPSIIKSWASPTVILNDEQTLVHAVANDNNGVTSVSVQISGAASGSASMTLVGGEWQLLFSSARTDPGSYGDITFTLTAYDAAGNPSGPVSVTVDRQYFG